MEIPLWYRRVLKNERLYYTFRKKENGGFDCYFKTAVRQLVFCLGAWEICRHNNGFFYYRWAAYQ